MKSQQYKRLAKLKGLKRGKSSIKSQRIRRGTFFFHFFGNLAKRSKTMLLTLPMKKSFTTKHLVLVLQCQESFQTPFGRRMGCRLICERHPMHLRRSQRIFLQRAPCEKQSVEVKGKVTSSPKRSGAISLGQGNIDWNFHHNAAQPLSEPEA